MKKELKYISNKIDYLQSKVFHLIRNSNNYTTSSEINFFTSSLKKLQDEIEILENIKRFYDIAYQDGFNAKNGLGANTSHEIPVPPKPSKPRIIKKG